MKKCKIEVLKTTFHEDLAKEYGSISYMPSGASSGSVTATALPVANSADWIVVLYKYIDRKSTRLNSSH